MSGLFDKKASGATRREVRTQKEQSARKKTRLVAVSVVSAVAILFAGALFVNSNYIRRTLPAITIGGVSFSAAEFDYFYSTAYSEYAEMVNQYYSEIPDLAASMLPSRDMSHSKQVYDQTSGETWADFFNGRATETMSGLVQFYNAAKAAGYVLSDETRERLEYQLSDLKMQGEWYSSMYPQNYPSADSFIQAMYGSSINENVLRKVMEFIFTAASYGEHMRDSFTYSSDRLESYYNENHDDLDVYRYRMFLVRPETLYEEDFDSVEEYEAANEAALDEARELAEQIALMIETEEEFIEAARAYDDYTYASDNSTLREQQGERLDANFEPWLCDEERAYGNVASIDLSFGTYVAFFIERDDNNYQMTAMRQILIMRDWLNPEDYPLGEDDPDYIEAFENADRDVTERANEVYNLFVSGGSSEAKLLELIEDGKSDDTTEGGYYEGMARFSYEYQSRDGYAMRVVPEIEQWLFDGERQVGDSELVYTKDYGYHLIIYMEPGELFRDHISADRMRIKDFTDWTESLPEVEAVRKWAFLFTQS